MPFPPYCNGEYLILIFFNKAHENASTQFPVPYSLIKTPTHSVYYPTASFKQPASKKTVKNNTHSQCVFRNVGTLGSSVRLVVRPNNLDSVATSTPRISTKTFNHRNVGTPNSSVRTSKTTIKKTHFILY